MFAIGTAISLIELVIMLVKESRAAIRWLKSMEAGAAQHDGVISKKWIRTLLNDADKVNVIYGYTYSPVFNIDTRYSEAPSATLPKNVYLIGLHESYGIWEMAQKMTAWGGIKDIQYQAHDSTDLTSAGTTVTVGGASINAQTGRVLEYLGSEFRIEYPQHRLIDEVQGECLEPEIVNDVVQLDYGYFLVINESPFTRERLLVVSGTWPLGSLGAQRFLLAPTQEFIEVGEKYLGNKESFLAVVSVRTSEGTIAKPTVEYHRTISGLPKST